MKRLLIAGALLLPHLGACREQQPGAGGPTTTRAAPSGSAASGSAASGSAASSATVGSAQYQDDELPVSADFEAQAEQAVTGDNYLNELDRIEAAMRDGGHGR